MIQKSEPILVDSIPEDLAPLIEMGEKVIIGTDLLARLGEQVVPRGLFLSGSSMPDKDSTVFSTHGLPEGDLVMPCLIVKGKLDFYFFLRVIGCHRIGGKIFMMKWMALFLVLFTSAWAEVEDDYEIYKKNWVLSEIVEFIKNNNISLEQTQFVISGLQCWYEKKAQGIELNYTEYLYEISGDYTYNHTYDCGEISPPE